MGTDVNPMVTVTTTPGGTVWAAGIAAFKIAP
jgi:hypothetical protein